MIPSTAHFIWFGDTFPWASQLALLSALRFGGFERAVLHHEARLLEHPSGQELQRIGGLELRTIDEAELLGSSAQAGVELLRVYRELELPAARANVLRVAILLREGGVYLDCDTITVRDLSELRASCRAFVGQERIALPDVVRRTKNPLVLGAAFMRRGVRDVFRRLPEGWSWFRLIERFYPAAANNAVLGAEPGHPLLAELTRAMLELPPGERKRRFALGTHLLQRVVASHASPGFRLLAPAFFYPLGPEISEHWFRLRGQLPRLERVILDETLVVHWYASVRTKSIVPRLDPEYVARHAHQQLFSALASRILDPTRTVALSP